MAAGNILRRTFLLSVTLLCLGCNLLDSDSRPTAFISQPADGSTVRTGREVEILSTASDDTGVVRIDLYVNDELIATDTPPQDIPQLSYSVVQRWVPPAPGTVLIQVLAYDERGQRSAPAAVEITAVGPALARAAPTSTPLPTATPLPAAATTPSPAATATPEMTVTGTVSVQGLNVRAGPGTDFDILTTIPRDTAVLGMARTDDGEWARVRLADERVGWVAATFVSWEDDIAALPVVQE